MKQSKALNDLRTINQLNNYEPYLRLKVLNKELYEALKTIRDLYNPNGYVDSFEVYMKVDKSLKDYEANRGVIYEQS